MFVTHCHFSCCFTKYCINLTSLLECHLVGILMNYLKIISHFARMLFIAGAEDIANELTVHLMHLLTFLVSELK